MSKNLKSVLIMGIYRSSAEMAAKIKVPMMYARKKTMIPRITANTVMSKTFLS